MANVSFGVAAQATPAGAHVEINQPPGCPKSSRFSGQKSAGEALEINLEAGSSLHALEQIAKPRAKAAAAGSDCRPRGGRTD